MPIDFREIPECRVNVFTHTGSIPDDELISFYRSVYENKRFDASKDYLVDLRQADSSPRSVDALRLLVDLIAPHMRAVETAPRVAVIAPHSLSFGLARMYEVFSDEIPWTFVVFRDAEAACAWLGLPENATTT